MSLANEATMQFALSLDETLSDLDDVLEPWDLCVVGIFYSLWNAMLIADAVTEERASRGETEESAQVRFRLCGRSYPPEWSFVAATSILDGDPGRSHIVIITTLMMRCPALHDGLQRMGLSQALHELARKRRFEKLWWVLREIPNAEFIVGERTAEVVRVMYESFERRLASRAVDHATRLDAEEESDACFALVTDAFQETKFWPLFKDAVPRQEPKEAASHDNTVQTPKAQPLV